MWLNFGRRHDSRAPRIWVPYRVDSVSVVGDPRLSYIPCLAPPTHTVNFTLTDMKFTAVLAAAVVSAASSFRQYPLYKQCDPRWGSDEMGTSTNGTGERATVCKEGCAMSSLSMALAGLGATIDGSLVTPGIFNLWLEVNNGYLCLSGDCNNLVLDAVTRLNSTIQLVGENPKPTIPVIRAGLDRGDTIYIAHVPKLVHFVLLTNYTDAESDWFTVNDAFYNSTGYMWSNFSDIIIYNIVPKAAMSQPPAVSGSLVASSQSGVFRVPSAEDGPRVAPEIVATAGIAPGAAPVIPFKYPLMKQCGMPYSNNKMASSLQPAYNYGISCRACVCTGMN